MDSSPKQLKPPRIHWVSATDSDEFTLLSWALNCSSVVGLDAEWKPFQTQQFSFPTVSLLQIACQVSHRVNNRDSDSVEEEEKETDPLSNLWVFLVDLLEIPCSSIWEILRDMFVSPDILKLGFRFKQDLIYLSSTFCSKGCDPGFDRVEPFLDITSIYHHMQHKQSGRKLSKEMKSLATICQDMLGLYLSKELQCSDWSHRPLTEEQKLYAAADAQCLLEIFAIFQGKLLKEGNLLQGISELHPPDTVIGLQEILEKHDFCDNVLRVKLCKASDMIRSATASEIHPRIHAAVGPISRSSCRNTIPFDVSLAKIVRKYGEKILLKDSDRKPRTSKKKGKRPPLVSSSHKEKLVENCSEWQGPPPWDLSIGGDGFPKFLCDAMVEGLAKHLRCVGIDAATSSSKKPEPRQLIDQAHKEKRVLLTRDVKLLRHDYLIRNQVYRVKSLLKNDQLLEVIEIFQLKICEDQLMSRCTKCNGRFIQKALTTEEAVEAAKGFQVIPSCLFDRNLEFWQCMDCNQLYWEGTQYHNAVQKFIDVCKLSE